MQGERPHSHHRPRTSLARLHLGGIHGPGGGRCHQPPRLPRGLPAPRLPPLPPRPLRHPLQVSSCLAQGLARGWRHLTRAWRSFLRSRRGFARGLVQPRVTSRSLVQPLHRPHADPVGPRATFARALVRPCTCPCPASPPNKDAAPLALHIYLGGWIVWRGPRCLGLGQRGLGGTWGLGGG